MKCKCICNKDLSRFLRTLWSWNGPSEEFYRSKELDFVPLLVFKYRLLRRAGLTLDDLAHYAERRVWLATLPSTRGRNTLVLKLEGESTSPHSLQDLDFIGYIFRKQNSLSLYFTSPHMHIFIQCECSLLKLRITLFLILGCIVFHPNFMSTQNLWMWSYLKIGC